MSAIAIDPKRVRDLIKGVKPSAMVAIATADKRVAIRASVLREVCDVASLKRRKATLELVTDEWPARDVKDRIALVARWGSCSMLRQWTPKGVPLDGDGMPRADVTIGVDAARVVS